MDCEMMKNSKESRREGEPGMGCLLFVHLDKICISIEKK